VTPSARNSASRAGDAREPHGRFLAGEAGELVGVSGTTIGQWARRGYISSSQGEGDPRVYSVEDVEEAAVVAWLREHGVPHAQIRAALARLGGRDRWPLIGAPLAATTGEGRARIALREPDGTYLLTRRGWQLTALPPPLERVRPRFHRACDTAFR
jgi:DNA-binding transcriptional MerR regulator